MSQLSSLCRLVGRSACRGAWTQGAWQVGASRTVSTTAVNWEKYFTPKHEWVEITENVGTVGVSKFAADALGDIVYAQLPEPGESIEKGAEAGALESVKAAGEVYSPVSGSVTAKNEEVENVPALINQHAETEGWLFKVELTNAAGDIEGLMNEEDYKVYLESQAEH